MAEQDQPSIEPPKKPAKRRANQATLKVKKLQKEAKSPLPPPPVVPQPKAPAPPLTPTQLQAPAPPQGAQPAPPAEVEREAKLLEQLFTKSLRRSETVAPANDIGMKLIQAIAINVAEAKPISEIDLSLVPHLGEMQSKLHLMLQAIQYHNAMERLAMYSLLRWTLEKGLWNDLLNDKLSPAEKLALLGMAIKETDKCEQSAAKSKESLEESGQGTGSDIQTTVEKVDRSVKVEDTAATKELEGTSAVGRELTRRLLDTAAKAANQKVKEALLPAEKVK